MHFPLPAVEVIKLEFAPAHVVGDTKASHELMRLVP
jgi:hypothetical protein